MGSNRRLISGRQTVAYEPLNQGGFSHVGVSQEHDLPCRVVLCLVRVLALVNSTHLERLVHLNSI